jgi:hypothetical protein
MNEYARVYRRNVTFKSERTLRACCRRHLSREWVYDSAAIERRLRGLLRYEPLLLGSRSDVPRPLHEGERQHFFEPLVCLWRVLWLVH